MSYQAPSISATGLSLPAYLDVIGLFTSNFQSIYGPGSYLGDDSADFQLMSIFALAVADSYSAVQLAVNNFNPRTAIGSLLSQLVALNGLARKVASFSSCAVTIVGTPGTTISNGVVRDSVPQQGALWSLPTPLVIPGSGTINTIATCQTIGALNALPGQLNQIATPTAGWTSVTNSAAATLGQPVETDSQLRTRQAVSTELPSITTLAGTIAGVAAVEGVTRYNILENPTNAVDGYGNPPHSLTAVVEGGTLLDVATAIYNNRGIGCDTNGTTTQPVVDQNSGVTFDVDFYLPTDVSIYVIVNVNPLPGFSASSTAQAIQTALVNYLNSLQIGELVTYSALVATAMSVTVLTAPTFSITSLFLGTAPSPSTTSDIVLTFNQVAEGLSANVQVNS